MLARLFREIESLESFESGGKLTTQTRATAATPVFSGSQTISHVIQKLRLPYGSEYEIESRYLS